MCNGTRSRQGSSYSAAKQVGGQETKENKEGLKRE